MVKQHKDVEYFVHDDNGHGDRHTQHKTFDEAAGAAVARSASTGSKIYIDVCVYSRAGAKWYGGDDAVAQYDEDPETSVHERIVITAVSQGRVA